MAYGNTRFAQQNFLRISAYICVTKKHVLSHRYYIFSQIYTDIRRNLFFCVFLSGLRQPLLASFLFAANVFPRCAESLLTLGWKRLFSTRIKNISPPYLIFSTRIKNISSRIIFFGAAWQDIHCGVTMQVVVGDKKRTPAWGRSVCVVSVGALFAGDVVDALLMTSAGKLGVEELVKALAANVLGDEASGEDNDVGVVVLADEVGNLGLPDEAGADLLVLVERHADAFARAAHGYAGIDFAPLDAFGQSVAVGGVVAGLLGVGAVVFVGDAFLVEIFLYELLQGICRMV